MFIHIKLNYIIYTPTAKSPVFGMINSTISGLSTIRSSNSQDRLLRIFDSAQVSYQFFKCHIISADNFN